MVRTKAKRALLYLSNNIIPLIAGLIIYYLVDQNAYIIKIIAE